MLRTFTNSARRSWILIAGEGDVYIRHVQGVEEVVSPRLAAMQSDERLAQLVGEGDERAFEALVRRYRRPLSHYCRRLGCAEALREDVMQLAFLRAWLALARGDRVRDVRAWLYRIVHNTALNAMQARAGRGEAFADVADLEVVAARGLDPDAVLAIRSTLRDLAQLPALQREALLLSAVDGRPYDEVADALGISEGAVRGLLYRARVALRSAAAALAPPQLLGWSSGVATRTAPSAARLAEIASPGGAGGMTASVLKGAAAALTAAAVVTGVALGPLRRSQEHVSSHAASGRSRAAVGAGPQTAGADGAPVVTARSGGPRTRQPLASTTPTPGAPSVSVVEAPRSSNRRTAAHSQPSPSRPQPAAAPQGVSASAPRQAPTVPVPLAPVSTAGSGAPGQPLEGSGLQPHEQEGAGEASSSDDREEKEGADSTEGPDSEARENPSEGAAKEPSGAGEAESAEPTPDR